MLGPKVLRVVVLTLNSIIMLGPTLLQASCMTGKHIYVPHLPKELYVLSGTVWIQSRVSERLAAFQVWYRVT